MCGICGTVELADGMSADRDLLGRMVAVLEHRGPDDRGVYLDRQAGLGHVRLAIIDLSHSGHQPMSSLSGRYRLVFNGEIYNYRELQQDLRYKGYTFSSNSDTEVLANLWEEYGEESICRLEGMFAFAVWDRLTEELFLVRDRLGQKPLFYAVQNNRFYFASEIKAILQDSVFKVSVDYKSILYYLTYQSVPAPFSAFNNINKLPAGKYLKLDKQGRKTEKQYWSLSYSRQYAAISEEELEEMILAELTAAVRKRLMSDVPLGAFLSGGVDSSLVVALMAEMISEKVKTFSIGFNEKTHDETAYARRVAELYGTDHHEFKVTPDAQAIFNELVWHYNEPFADPSAVPTYYLSKMASEYVTVALSGDGGDENFGGYNRYYFPWGVNPEFAGNTGNSLLELIPWYCGIMNDKNFGWFEKPLELNYYSYLFYKRFANWNEESLFKLLRPVFWKEADFSLPFEFMLDLFAESAAESFFDKCTYFDIKHYIADTLMTKVDIASMAFSLEVRSPMLDHQFVEMAAKIPAVYKTRGGRDIKYILKKVASRYLPEDLIYRDKMGFGVPIGDWFRGEMKEMMYDVLLSRDATGRGYFNTNYVEELLNMHVAGKDQQYLIWTLLMLEEWHKMFVDKKIPLPGDTEVLWQVDSVVDTCSESEVISLQSKKTEMYFLDKSLIKKGEGDNEYYYDIHTSLECNASVCTSLEVTPVLYEYFVPLGYPQTERIEIAASGSGRYCYCQGVIYFSTSDNSDPRVNRHCYTFTLSRGAYEEFGRRRNN